MATDSHSTTSSNSATEATQVAGQEAVVRSLELVVLDCDDADTPFYMSSLAAAKSRLQVLRNSLGSQTSLDMYKKRAWEQNDGSTTKRRRT